MAIIESIGRLKRMKRVRDCVLEPHWNLQRRGRYPALFCFCWCDSLKMQKVGSRFCISKRKFPRAGPWQSRALRVRQSRLPELKPSKTIRAHLVYLCSYSCFLCICDNLLQDLFKVSLWDIEVDCRSLPLQASPLHLSYPATPPKQLEV